MKKNKSDWHIRPLIFNTNSYYKEIGVQAAIHAFSKSKFIKKLKSVSPTNKITSPNQKDLLKLDKSQIKTYRSPLARDISHLRDLFNNPIKKQIEIPIKKCISLPFDIKTVKDLLKSSDIYGNPFNEDDYLLTSCRRDTCLKSLYLNTSKLPKIEEKLLGSPTSKQECDLLRNWIKIMKENYCWNDDSMDNSDAIYMMATREIIRQASIQYHERGELLKEIIGFFIIRYEHIKEKIENVYKDVDKQTEKLLKDYELKEKQYLAKINAMEERVEVLSIRLQEKNKNIEELNKKVFEKNEQIEELRSKYLLSRENSFRGNNLYNRLKSMRTRLKESPPSSPFQDNFLGVNPLSVISSKKSDQEESEAITYIIPYGGYNLK